MKILFFFLAFITFAASASIVGISTHPLNEEARVMTGEMMGYMSQRNELGAGIRYTQELKPGRLVDFSVFGGQNSRAMSMGTGMDFEMLEEDVNQPRVSLKPFFQHQRFETTTSSLFGVAPTIRKGVSFEGFEFFPYLALPYGMKINNGTDAFVYYASLTLGASMPFPGAHNRHLLLSVEGNKNMGAASDYIGCLVSWIWK